MHHSVSWHAPHGTYHMTCSFDAAWVSSLELTGCCAGMLLKEMIEDLEWTAVGSNNSTVEVCMQRQPRRLLFTAQAAGSLQVRPILM